MFTEKKIRFFVLLQFFCMYALADVDIHAFKGIAERIDEKYQHLNPLWGQIALDTGIIFNIRFYGNFKSGEQNGTRNYIMDFSDADPTWNLIKLLFPSVTGSVGTTTNSDTNFAIYVVHPMTIAFLFKLADDHRLGNEIDTDERAQLLVNSMNIPKRKKNNVIKRTIIPLIENIRKSVSAESNSGFYPQFFTDTIISAFFVKKFNNQMDIWTFLASLNKVFGQSIARDIPQVENVLTIEDITTIDSQKTPNFEQAYNLINSNIFYVQTPYRESAPLVENETICAFIRKDNKIDPSLNFADCAETALRHVLNLLLYDPFSAQFDLSHFTQSLDFIPSKFFKNLENFYAVQPPKLANDSSTDVRIAWNKVVADMNDDMDAVKVKYVKGYNNETDTGFINFTRILQKIFNINLADLSDKSDEKIAWIKESFPILFKKINPKFTYRFSYNFEPHAQEIYGEISVIASQNGIPKFSFTISQTPLHAKVVNLKTLIDSPSDVKKTIANNLETLLKGELFTNLAPYQEGLLLLASKSAQHEPFVTFPQPLNNNNARITWLEKLLERKENNDVSPFLAHVFESMSWDDRETLKIVSPLVFKLTHGRYLDVVRAQVKGLIIPNFGPWYIRGGTWLSMHDFAQLKHIVITENGFSENDFSKLPPSLESLDLSKLSAFPTPSLTLKDFAKLKIVNLSGSRFFRLTLDNLPSLASLDIKDSNVSDDLVMNRVGQLKELDFYKWNIESLTLSEMPALEALSVVNTDIRKKLVLNDLSMLKKFTFDTSSVNKIELENLPLLGSVRLEGQNIKSLSIKNLALLKDCKIKGREINLENLPSIELLNFQFVVNSNILNLKNLSALKELNLGYSSIRTINIEDLPLLTKIDLKSTSLDDFTSIKNLILKNGTPIEIIFSSWPWNAFYIDSDGKRNEASPEWLQSIGGKREY